MKILFFLITALLVAQSLSAASIEVEACAEFEVIEASSPGVISSVPEQCVSVSLDVEPFGDLVSRTQSDTREMLFFWGGCNNTNQDVTFRAERRVRYSITSEAAGLSERTRARVAFSWIPESFTSGSDSMAELINTGISSGSCLDSFGRFSVFAEAGSGLDSNTLSQPSGVTGLFFDPGNPGHGFNFIRHEAGLTIYYYGHTADGERLWLVSDLYEDALFYSVPMEMEMFEVTEGQFGLPVLPESSWGSLTVRLNDCDSGTASLNGLDGQLFFIFVRLAGLENQGCY